MRLSRAVNRLNGRFGRVQPLNEAQRASFSYRTSASVARAKAANRERSSSFMVTASGTGTQLVVVVQAPTVIEKTVPVT